MNGPDVVVDDHILLATLLGEEPSGLRQSPGRLLTTGLYYHRLCRAIAVEGVVGSLSSALGMADPMLGAAAVRAISALPDHIGMLSLRELAWPIAQLLAAGARLNLLALEALAATASIGGELCLATVDDNPMLRAAAEERGIACRLVAL